VQVFEALFLGAAKRFFGVACGGGGKVGEKEIGGKAEKRVGDFGVLGGDESGNFFHLFRGDVAGNKQGACDHRYLGVIPGFFGRPGKVPEGEAVRNPSKRKMQAFVESFEVELEDSP